MDSIYQGQTLPCDCIKTSENGIGRDFSSSSSSAAADLQPSGPLYNHFSLPPASQMSAENPSACSSSLGVPRPSLRYPSTLQTAVGSDSSCHCRLTPPNLQMPSYSSSAPRARAMGGGQGEMKRKRWKGTQGRYHHFRSEGQKKSFLSFWDFSPFFLPLGTGKAPCSQATTSLFIATSIKNGDVPKASFLV